MNEFTEQDLKMTPIEDDDAGLVTAAKQDLAAFEKLYDKYVQSVFRYLLSRVGNVTVAEDLTSVTFLAAIEMFGHYRHRGIFGAWVITIAKRKAVDYFRKEKVQEKIENLWPEKIFEDDVMKNLLDSERKKTLLSVLDNLTEKEQELIRLRFVADLKFREMAALMNRSEGAVKKSFYRLLEKMKIALEDYNA